MSYRDVVLTDLPHSYWRLSEALGDYTNEVPGSPVGTVVGAGLLRAQDGLLAGDASKSLYVNGAGTYVSVPGMPNPAAADFSIECWFKADTSGGVKLDQALAGKWSGQGYTLWVHFATGEVNFVVTGVSGNFVASGVPLDGGIHHIVGVRSVGDAILYIDGVEVARKAIVGTVGSPAQDFEIGRLGGSDGTNIKGWIDEVAYYEHALTPARVAAHHTSGITLPPPPVVAGGRHCLLIGPTTIIGAAAIIGDSCPGFPIWSASDEVMALTDQTCGATDLPDESVVPLLLSEPVERSFS